MKNESRGNEDDKLTCLIRHKSDEIQAQEFGAERQGVDSRDKGMCIEMSICNLPREG